MKLDQDWNVLWQYSHYGTWYGTYSDIFSTMQQASDGGYILQEPQYRSILKGAARSFF